MDGSQFDDLDSYSFYGNPKMQKTPTPLKNKIKRPNLKTSKGVIIKQVT